MGGCRTIQPSFRQAVWRLQSAQMDKYNTT
jgi:hypothetical protein